MPVVTIPKKLAEFDDLVVIPRGEYEDLLVFKKIIPEFEPTPVLIRKLRAAEKDYKAGKTIPWSRVKNELARLHQAKSGKTA